MGSEVQSHQPSHAIFNPGRKRVDDETPSHLLPWSQVIKRNREKAKRLKPPDAPILSRRAFCAADKRVVCEMLMENPNLTHQDVANHFGVDRSMISRVWAKKTQWLRSKHSGEHKFARKRVPRYWQIDYALEPWLHKCRQDNIIVTDKMIREHALQVAEKEGMRGGGHPYHFDGGRKWLLGFKNRFGIIDGVATRMGYTELDLAREKAFGNYPLDEPFWIMLPDEDGNCIDPWDMDEGPFPDMDFEIRGGGILYRPRSEATGSSSGESAPPRADPLPSTLPHSAPGDPSDLDDTTMRRPSPPVVHAHFPPLPNPSGPFDALASLSSSSHACGSSSSAFTSPSLPGGLPDSSRGPSTPSAPGPLDALAAPVAHLSWSCVTISPSPSPTTSSLSPISSLREYTSVPPTLTSPDLSAATLPVCFLSPSLPLPNAVSEDSTSTPYYYPGLRSDTPPNTDVGVQQTYALGAMPSGDAFTASMIVALSQCEAPSFACEDRRMVNYVSSRAFEGTGTYEMYAGPSIEGMPAQGLT